MLIAKTIKLLGGYTEDEILTKAVKDLYNTISTDDILRKDDGFWWQGGKTLTQAELDVLKAEASNLMKSRLWKALKMDIQYQANKAMFEKAKSENDLTAGKLWLYTIDCIETRLKELANLSR